MMNKHHEWEADLTPHGTTRPGEYAAEKAVESLHGSKPSASEPRTRPGGSAAQQAVEAIHEQEDAHWRAHYAEEPYHEPGRPYDYYARAYRTGYEGRTAHEDKRFEDIEPELEAKYRREKQDSEPEWQDIKSAVRASWNRLTHLFPDKG
jgi:hypothetical protein